MCKSAAFNRKQTQCINNRNTVFYKSGVCFGIDSECGQCNDNLSAGFTANSVNRTVTAVVMLFFRQTGNCFVNRCFDFGVCAVIWSKRLNCHTGHIGVGNLARECPAAVFKLFFKNISYELFTGNLFLGICINRNFIIITVECDKCPDRTVDALLLNISHICQTHKKIVAVNIRYIIACGCKSKNDS